jgi:polyisoprenoid-binding protein YceI
MVRRLLSGGASVTRSLQMVASCGYIRPVTSGVWHFDGSEGRLLVHTDVTGRAAKMGHRLTIAMTSWRAAVKWDDGEPADVELAVEVDSLQVLRGEGGLTPLSGPEKALARSNALKVLGADRFPQIHFKASGIEETSGGYRLTGSLNIHGITHERAIELHVDDHGDSWGLSCEADVRQTEFGIKPYSMLMGSMKVVDTVTVGFTADRLKSA